MKNCTDGAKSPDRSLAAHVSDQISLAGGLARTAGRRGRPPRRRLPSSSRTTRPGFRAYCTPGCRIRRRPSIYCHQTSTTDSQQCQRTPASRGSGGSCQRSTAPLEIALCARPRQATTPTPRARAVVVLPAGSGAQTLRMRAARRPSVDGARAPRSATAGHAFFAPRHPPAFPHKLVSAARPLLRWDAVALEAQQSPQQHHVHLAHKTCVRARSFLPDRPAAAYGKRHRGGSGGAIERPQRQ